jgi:hypothetical protein
MLALEIRHILLALFSFCLYPQRRKSQQTQLSGFDSGVSGMFEDLFDNGVQDGGAKG